MLAFILGTRPEIIKLAPLIRRCVQGGHDYMIIHTGQHYDHAVDGIFFEELALPQPHINLKAAASSQGEFFGNVIPALEKVYAGHRFSAVVVQGDTNSAFAGALMAQRAGIPVAHVEAGLRSDDWTMPEEGNRVFVDRIAERLYAPTALQQERLLQEGIPPGRIVVTGNTVLDAVNEHLTLAHDVTLPPEMKPDVPYAVVTLHRPALVDNPDLLQMMLLSIDAALADRGVRGVFPVHPRTRKILGDSVLSSIVLHPPVGYLPMLHLLAGATLVVTDSGGLQEESAILKVPCVTVRENTERPETVEAGGNTIAGLDPSTVAHAIGNALSSQPVWKPLYANEHPSDTMMDDLRARHYL